MAELSLREFEQWLPVSEALRLVEAGYYKTVARQTILTRFRGGQLRWAAKSSWEGIGGVEARTRGLSEIELPPWFIFQEDTEFWETGRARFVKIGERGPQNDKTATYFNVRFEPPGLSDLIPKPALVTNTSPAPTPLKVRPGYAEYLDRVGRPRKDFWDDLWIEICRQLYFGELKPTKQKDIEKVMLAWAKRNGYELSLASARLRAKPLFALIKSKVRRSKRTPKRKVG